MPLWYAGICDRLERRIRLWLENYDAGRVYATRPFMDLDGVKNIVTIRKHRIPFHPKEMEHLMRILHALRPGMQLTQDFEKVAQNLRHGRLLPNGYYEVELAFYQQDLEELVKVLEEARTGKKPLEKTIVSTGGPLWK